MHSLQIHKHKLTLDTINTNTHTHMNLDVNVDVVMFTGWFYVLITISAAYWISCGSQAIQSAGRNIFVRLHIYTTPRQTIPIPPTIYVFILGGDPKKKHTNESHQNAGARTHTNISFVPCVNWHLNNKEY